jgi:CRP/FNR family cyclic AMP-dependent transcriptional regulator
MRRENTMAKTTFDIGKIPASEDRTVRFPDGGVIFLKGDVGDCAFIVKSGRVVIREGGRALETMERGELFGEMTLIDSEPRSASAVAVGPTELVTIDRSTFDTLVRETPDFAMMVMRLMARRLRATVSALRPPDELLPVVQTPNHTAA